MELLIVIIIIGLLATIAIPKFDGVRQRAFNAAALADLNNASKEIERYFNDNFRYPADENELIVEGYSHTPGVSFTTFTIDCDRHHTRRTSDPISADVVRAHRCISSFCVLEPRSVRGALRHYAGGFPGAAPCRP